MGYQNFSFAGSFNIVAGLYLLFFVLDIVVGVYVFFKDHKSHVSIVFLLLTIVFAILHLGETFFSWSPFKSDAFFFTAIKSIGFLFWWPLMLNLFLLMRSKKMAKGWKLLLVILYAYCFVTVISFFTGVSHAADYIRIGNVWIDKPYWSPIGTPYLFMMPFCLICYFYLLFELYYTAKKNKQDLLRKQARLMIFFAIPFSILGLSFNIIFPALGLVLPAIGHLFIGFWVLTIGYAIVRYRLLIPTLGFASKEIFTIAGEMIVITDLQFKIIETNIAFQKTIGKDKTSSTLITDLVNGLDPAFLECEGIEKEIVNQGVITDIAGSLVHVSIKKSNLYDRDTCIGFVFVLADITELINQNEILEAKVQERTSDLLKAKLEAERRLEITGVYTRQSIVKLIESGVDPRSFSPETKKVAILFSDIRDFTRIFEFLSPIETVSILNEYFNQMNECILANGGEIDKLIGDCIMAIHNTVDEALNSAIEMRYSLRNFNSQRPVKGRINNGIGINYGEVVAGNIGSSGKMDYTVIGDIVNTSSRIESLSKFYHLPILISGEVKNNLKNHYIVRFIDRALVKGRSSPISIFECFDYETEDIIRTKLGIEKDLFDLYGMYEKGDFSTALKGYKAIRNELGPHSYYPGLCKDPVLDFYITRCASLEQKQKEGVLENWNGVYEFIK